MSADISTPQIIKHFYTDSNLPESYDEPKLLEDMKRLRNYHPIKSEIKEKDNFMEYLVREWFSQKIKQHYEELSPEILTVQREIRVKPEFVNGRSRYEERKRFSFDIPMFLSAPLEGKGWESEIEREIDERDYRFNLKSRMPKIPLEIRKNGREAIALTYRTYAEAVTTDVLNDVIEENPKYAPAFDGGELVVLWKARPQDIHVEARVIDNDPALVLNYDERHYLVDMWDEPDEEPFKSTLELFKKSNLEKLPRVENHL
jgi:hypothetical protein